MTTLDERLTKVLGEDWSDGRDYDDVFRALLDKIDELEFAHILQTAWLKSPDAFAEAKRAFLEELKNDLANT